MYHKAHIAKTRVSDVGRASSPHDYQNVQPRCTVEQARMRRLAPAESYDRMATTGWLPVAQLLTNNGAPRGGGAAGTGLWAMVNTLKSDKVQGQ